MKARSLSHRLLAAWALLLTALVLAGCFSARKGADKAQQKVADAQAAIATNKRIHPTRLILDHLGWLGHFDHIYALDLFSPRLPHKAAMIERLMQDQQIPATQAVYIGDRPEDGHSADANKLPFIAATWGYGSIAPEEMPPHWRAVGTPDAMLAALLAD